MLNPEEGMGLHCDNKSCQITHNALFLTLTVTKVIQGGGIFLQR